MSDQQVQYQGDQPQQQQQIIKDSQEKQLPKGSVYKDGPKGYDPNFPTRQQQSVPYQQRDVFQRDQLVHPAQMGYQFINQFPQNFENSFYPHYPEEFVRIPPPPGGFIQQAQSQYGQFQGRSSFQEQLPPQQNNSAYRQRDLDLRQDPRIIQRPFYGYQDDPRYNQSIIQPRKENFENYSQVRLDPRLNGQIQSKEQVYGKYLDKKDYPQDFIQDRPKSPQPYVEHQFSQQDYQSKYDRGGSAKQDFIHQKMFQNFQQPSQGEQANRMTLHERGDFTFPERKNEFHFMQQRNQTPYSQNAQYVYPGRYQPRDQPSSFEQKQQTIQKQIQEENRQRLDVPGIHAIHQEQKEKTLNQLQQEQQEKINQRRKEFEEEQKNLQEREMFKTRGAANESLPPQEKYPFKSEQAYFNLQGDRLDKYNEVAQFNQQAGPFPMRPNFQMSRQNVQSQTPAIPIQQRIGYQNQNPIPNFGENAIRGPQEIVQGQRIQSQIQSQIPKMPLPGNLRKPVQYPQNNDYFIPEGTESQMQFAESRLGERTPQKYLNETWNRRIQPVNQSVVQKMNQINQVEEQMAATLQGPQVRGVPATQWAQNQIMQDKYAPRFQNAEQSQQHLRELQRNQSQGEMSNFLRGTRDNFDQNLPHAKYYDQNHRNRYQENEMPFGRGQGEIRKDDLNLNEIKGPKKYFDENYLTRAEM